MVKVFPSNYSKSFILEYFRAVKLKIFFNHGESIPQQSFKKWQYCAENDPEKPEIGMKKWLDTLLDLPINEFLLVLLRVGRWW